MTDEKITTRELDILARNDAEWRAQVFRKLENLETKLDSRFQAYDKKHNKLVVTVTTLNTKVSLIVAISATIAGFIGSLIGKHGG